MKKKLFYPITVFGLIFLLHAIFSIWKAPQICPQPNPAEKMSLLSVYFKQQDFFLSFSYALAGGFTIYALLKFLQNRSTGVAGVAGGAALTGILYTAGCFLSGCCGSPMLAVYLSLFGSSFLGLTKALIAIITTVSVVIGYFWLEKKSKSCCVEVEKE
ncbi:MAG: hypothetical protein ACYS0I_07350 [Planctomycetota bacterium]|jgi:hypothetical protein